MKHSGERGQTIPFWVFAVIISLALSLFVMNYTNTIRWHIRGQNAADAAALASMAGEAGIQNQITMAEYESAVDEYRVRSVIYAAINAGNAVGADATQSTINGDGSPKTATKTCNPSTKHDDNSVDCDNAYDQQPRYYDEAVLQYANSVAKLYALRHPAVPSSEAAAPVPTGVATPVPVPSAPPGSSVAAAFSLAQSHQHCWDRSPQSAVPLFDCAFNYTIDLSKTGPTSTEVVDVMACRKVTSTAPGFIARTLPAQFTALARSAATLAALPAKAFEPGKEIDQKNPTPNTPYQPIESCPPPAYHQTATGKQCDDHAGWLVSPAYDTDFSGLNVTATFYVPALAAPPPLGKGTDPQETASCQQG